MTVEEWLGKDNKLGIDIWNRKYRDGNETFDEWLDRVSGGDEDVRRLIVEKKMLFGGRTLTNRGTNSRGSMSNCYSEGFVDDSVDDIMKTVTNIALTFKSQGGEGISLSKLRPKGCGVNDGRYESDGIVPFMELFNQTTESISQGGSRKGALIMTLDAWHKESEDFIKIKSEQGRIQKANLSLEIDDEFMECVKKYYDTGEVITKHISRDYEGNHVEYDITPIKLYKLMMEKAWDWAEPGCLFTNRFRNYNLMEFCDDYNIETCNPSLRAGTRVLTKNGIYNIEHLVGKEFEVQTLNGEYATAKCFLSGHNKPLYEITLENGEKLYATKEHKWAILNNGRYTKTFTEDLQPGDLLPYTKNNSLKFGTKGTYEDGFFIGFLYGDGSITIRKDDNRYQYSFTFGKEKKEVGILDIVKSKLEKITNKEINYNTRNRGKEDWYEICCSNNLLKEYMFSFGVYSDKHILPKYIYTDLSEDFRKGFIDGLFSSDGHVDLVKDAETISLTSCSYEFIKAISNLLWWYGIRNNIHKHKTTLNEKVFYSYVLNMSKRAANVFSSIFKLTHINKQKKLKSIPDNIRKFKSDGHIKITNVILTDITEDVYDIHVYDDSHTFRINYCITGNCGEQSLSPHSACNLCSINLSEFVKDPFDKTSRFDVEDFSNTIDITVKAMDQIIDENKDRHALPEQREKVMNYRNIGIGIMGMYDMFCKLNITYGSKESIELMDAIMGFMFRRAVIASSHLAKEKGTFPMYSNNLLKSTIIKKHFTDEELHLLEIDKYGLRNCSLLSVAPTGTIGTILNISTGCEPAFQISYKRKTESLNGKDTYYDVYIDIAKQYMNKFNTKKLPHIFTTAGEIPWKSRVDMQAVLQNHVDTAISSTVNLPNSCTLEEIEQLYLYAWEKGLKGITIFRDGCKRAGILTTDKLTDKSDKNNESELQNNNSKENNSKEDDNMNHNTPSQLERGMIIKADNNGVGKIRILQTGCGTLHCCAYFDPIDGELIHTYLSKGSHGGCVGLLTGLSRMISISARGGIDIHTIIDQLFSVGACPAYVSRRVKCGDTSKGSNCPSAVGYALLNMYDEMQHEICDDINENLSKIETKENQKSNISSNNKTPKIAKPKCPECGEELFFEGGCMTCKSCGYSKCD